MNLPMLVACSLTARRRSAAEVVEVALEEEADVVVELLLLAEELVW